MHPKQKNNGSALITVIVFSLVLAVVSASILGYSVFERRMNERVRLTLRSENVAENIAMYAAEQLTTKLQRIGSAPVGVFPWTGTSANRIYMPPASTAGADNVLYSEFNSMTAVGNLEVRAGIEVATSYALVTDQTDPNYGLQTGTARVPIIAKGTAIHPYLKAVASYVEQDMQLTLIPLFQFGMFYNMDMEFYPSADFRVTGPVHTNGSLLVHADGGSSATVTFTGRVTATDYLIANQAIKCSTRHADGVISSNATGTVSSYPPTNGDVVCTNSNGTTTVSMKSTGSGTPSLASNLWADCRWGDTNKNITTALPTAIQLGNFKTWTTNQYNGYVAAGTDMKVSKLTLPGIGGYNETNLPATAEDDRQNGRQIIESPNHARYDGTNFTVTADTADLKQIKISWRAGLYIMVNPSDSFRSAQLPSGATVTLLPRSYRCWLNSGSAHTCKEVVLPGQPCYGFDDTAANATLGIQNPANARYCQMFRNDLPNRYTNTTSVGSNQVLRAPMNTTGATPLPLPASNRWTDYTAAPGTQIDTSGTNGTAGATDLTPTRIAGYDTGTAFPTYPADGCSAAALAVPEAYFFDMRRANNNGALGSAGDRTDFNRGTGTSKYSPRPIAKIDFDMARLKLMVDRTYSNATTSTTYKLDLPDGNGTGWGNCIYNAAAAPDIYGLGVLTTGSYSNANCFNSAGNLTQGDPFKLYYAPVDAAERATAATNPTGFAVPAADLTAAWYDGVAVYIHSVGAEQRSQAVTAGKNDRVDSGVRLWNGRGNVISLTPVGDRGCTIATNDALYVVGHFNADGDATDNTYKDGVTTASSSDPSLYADNSTERLCSVYGDSLTILSQPTFTRTGTSPNFDYYQTGGWCDAYSALPSSASSTGWNTSAAGSFDGVYNATAIRAGKLPSINRQGTVAAAGTSSTKFGAVDTEISTAFVVGIVPSNHKPTGLTDRSEPNDGTANNVNSGGANNFPRLLENWSGDTLYIRGSMVALFESRIAMEPFTHGRCYSAPSRKWGLHYGLSLANHDVPLEPVVYSATRMGFRQLSSTEYATRKATMEGWTAIP